MSTNEFIEILSDEAFGAAVASEEVSELTLIELARKLTRVTSACPLESVPILVKVLSLLSPDDPFVQYYIGQIAGELKQIAIQLYSRIGKQSPMANYLRRLAHLGLSFGA